MSECQHCSQTPEEHSQSAAATMEDFATMVFIASKFPELQETVDRVVTGWRTHSLPECDPLAIS